MKKVFLRLFYSFSLKNLIFSLFLLKEISGKFRVVEIFCSLYFLARLKEVERQDERRLVKEQLKYIAKLQQKQQKTLESQIVKHKQELEQLQKNYQQKQKEKEKQRQTNEQQLQKKQLSENESLNQDQSSQLKQLQVIILLNYPLKL